MITNAHAHKTYFVVSVGASDGSSSEVQLHTDGAAPLTFHLLGSRQHAALSELQRRQREKIAYASLDAFIGEMRGLGVLPRRVH